VIAAGRGDPDLYQLRATSHWPLLTGPLAGIAFGLAIVGLTRVATRRYAWARHLHTSFHDLLGPLTGREIVILALASSIGEEALFRGALMPWLGLWWQAGIFAVLHVGPRKRMVQMLPWTVSALVLGVALGELAIWTTNLGAPIAAHFVINFLNLRFIVADPRGMRRREPVSIVLLSERAGRAS
jgi:membrane protease YdiL (CAAX protease family)